MKHWLHRLQRLPRPHCVTDIHQNTMKTRATGITHATNVPMITNHTQTFMIHTHKQ